MFATQKQVAKLKARSVQWELNKFPTCDPMLPPIISLINQLDGVASVWSCEGHRREPGGRQHDSGFYIMFAVEQRAFPIMQRLYEDLRRRLKPYQHAADVERIRSLNDLPKEIRDTPEAKTAPLVKPQQVLPPHSKLNHLGINFSNRVWPFRYDSESTWFDCVILNADTLSDGAKDILFTELEQVLTEIVNEQGAANVT